MLSERKYDQGHHKIYITTSRLHNLTNDEQMYQEKYFWRQFYKPLWKIVAILDFTLASWKIEISIPENI